MGCPLFQEDINFADKMIDKLVAENQSAENQGQKQHPERIEDLVKDLQSMLNAAKTLESEFRAGKRTGENGMAQMLQYLREQVDWSQCTSSEPGSAS